jgi:hypothetical protein
MSVIHLVDENGEEDSVLQGENGRAFIVAKSPANLYEAGKPIAAAAANSAQMLWNPSTIKDLIIEDATIQASVGGEIYIIRGTATLISEVTTGHVGALDSDAPATVAELWHELEQGIPTGVRLAIGMVLHPSEGCCIYYIGTGKLRSTFNFTERDV